MSSSPTVPMPPAGPGQSQLLWVAIGCAGLAFLSLCITGMAVLAWGMSESARVNRPGSVAGVRVRGTLTSYVGADGLAVGTACDLPIERVERADGSVVCHVRMSCGGVPLYGNDESGFFPCTITPSGGGVGGAVMGGDAQTSQFDRDGAFTVDTGTRIFEAHDDAAGRRGAFFLTGTITTIE